MTKVIVLGKEDTSEKLKPIEFIKALNAKLEIESGTMLSPSEWDNVILLEKNYTNGLDCMYAYDNGRDGCIYFGHFNDGVVE